MESRWSDREAGEYLERYAPRWGEALALRVYTSRLIGQDPDLVMHGGGNTSLKGTVTTLLGDRSEALFVKGSGWDLDTIEPPGLPAVDLAPLGCAQADAGGIRGCAPGIDEQDRLAQVERGRGAQDGIGKAVDHKRGRCQSRFELLQ